MADFQLSVAQIMTWYGELAIQLKATQMEMANLRQRYDALLERECQCEVSDGDPGMPQVREAATSF